MKLGPLQKRWIQTLRQHPERQLTHELGQFNMDENGEANHCDYQVCCLGQAQILLHEEDLSPFVGDNLELLNGEDTDDVLSSSDWQAYCLRNPTGRFREPVKIRGTEHINLADMNDKGMTWLEIADYIEQHPENVFTGPA